MTRANMEAIQAMTNNPQKLSRPRLLEETKVSDSGQLFVFNHAFSIVLILSPWVTFRIALEISAAREEPLGNACISHTSGWLAHSENYKYQRNFYVLHKHASYCFYLFTFNENNQIFFNLYDKFYKNPQTLKIMIFTFKDVENYEV